MIKARQGGVFFSVLSFQEKKQIMRVVTEEKAKWRHQDGSGKKTVIIIVCYCWVIKTIRPDPGPSFV